MIEEAQDILNQIPRDLGTIKEELEIDLRAYDNGVCPNLEDAHDKHDHTIGKP
jgi:hypothetical protein